MKNLILVLLLALSCSISFAARPDKDGPFPKRMAGNWASQSSTVAVHVQDLGNGQVKVFVVLKGNTGRTIAIGSSVVEEDALFAQVTVSFGGRPETMLIRLIALDGQSGHEPLLQVSLGGSTVVFYKR